MRTSPDASKHPAHRDAPYELGEFSSHIRNTDA